MEAKMIELGWSRVKDLKLLKKKECRMHIVGQCNTISMLDDVHLCLLIETR